MADCGPDAWMGRASLSLRALGPIWYNELEAMHAVTKLGLECMQGNEGGNTGKEGTGKWR